MTDELYCSVASQWRRRPLVIVVDVLYFGFALLDESIALFSFSFLKNNLLLWFL